MAAESIGPARCPFCGSRARLSLAKSQLPVLTCNGCQTQSFARSDRSDGLFRALLITAAPAPEPAPDPAPAPTPAPTPAPAAIPPAPVRTARVGFWSL